MSFQIVVESVQDLSNGFFFYTIKFIFDDTLIKGQRINKLLDSLNK